MTTIHDNIEKLQASLGSRVTIMGHHYQSDDIMRHVQISGDSLELSQKVAGVESENIIFCGVHFMAESAALLSRPGQKVYLPAPDANCMMAKMAPATLLEQTIQALKAQGLEVLPLAYVNTSLALKAVVGKYGGAVCTSSNAEKMMRWAFDKSAHVLFLPDKNLGQNTAQKLGISPEEQIILNISGGGKNLQKISSSVKLLHWPGLCAIHAHFKPEHIQTLRSKYPDIKVAVHPECPPDVVNLSDAAGSTSFLIQYAADAASGSTIAIGTEINLVARLAKKHAGRINIIPLAESFCPDMAKTTPELLYETLLAIQNGNDNIIKPVSIDPAQAQPARDSLTRMLEACQ